MKRKRTNPGKIIRRASRVIPMTVDYDAEVDKIRNQLSRMGVVDFDKAYLEARHMMGVRC